MYHHGGVNFTNRLSGHGALRHPDVFRAEEELPIEVRLLDVVHIGDGEASSGVVVERCRCSNGGVLWALREAQGLGRRQGLDISVVVTVRAQLKGKIRNLEVIPFKGYQFYEKTLSTAGNFRPRIFPYKMCIKLLCVCE